jgi:hypothetical protein
MSWRLKPVFVGGSGASEAQTRIRMLLLSQSRGDQRRTYSRQMAAVTSARTRAGSSEASTTTDLGRRRSRER